MMKNRSKIEIKIKINEIVSRPSRDLACSFKFLQYPQILFFQRFQPFSTIFSRFFACKIVIFKFFSPKMFKMFIFHLYINEKLRFFQFFFAFFFNFSKSFSSFINIFAEWTTRGPVSSSRRSPSTSTRLTDSTRRIFKLSRIHRHQ